MKTTPDITNIRYYEQKINPRLKLRRIKKKQLLILRTSVITNRRYDKPPAETTKKCKKTTPDITDIRYYDQKINPWLKLHRNVWKQLLILQTPAVTDKR